jgi:hypothetical protein
VELAVRVRLDRWLWDCRTMAWRTDDGDSLIAKRLHSLDGRGFQFNHYQTAKYIKTYPYPDLLRRSYCYRSHHHLRPCRAVVAMDSHHQYLIGVRLVIIIIVSRYNNDQTINNLLFNDQPDRGIAERRSRNEARESGKRGHNDEGMCLFCIVLSVWAVDWYFCHSRPYMPGRDNWRNAAGFRWFNPGYSLVFAGSNI